MTDEQKSISLCGHTLTVSYPQQAAEAVSLAFAEFPIGTAAETGSLIEITLDLTKARFSAAVEGHCIGSGLNLIDLALLLLARAVYFFSRHCSGTALHGAAVRLNGKGVLLPGDSGEQSLLACWLLAHGCGYFTSQLVFLSGTGRHFNALPCPLSISAKELLLLEPALQDQISSGGPLLLQGRSALLFSHRVFADEPISELEELGLLLFAERRPEAELEITSLTPAQAAQRLAGRLANGLGGFSQAAALAREVPALALRWSNFSQLEHVLLPVLDFIVTERCSPKALRSFINAFAEAAQQKAIKGRRPVKQQTFPVPEATPRRGRPKITIGMATYDDYDGVYFSMQALRVYHAEIIDHCEILIIDNHPDGPCSESLKQLDSWTENCRYVPLQDVQGTGAARNAIFHHAAGEHVLCLDCHVLLVPGALKKLAEYFAGHSDTRDLLQGPLLHDDLRTISTHFEPVWRGGMYGVWGYDPRGDDLAGEAFAIPMQGIGLFACRRDAWPGFNPRFYGFGADEGYIHEKFRQAGGEVLCLPFLRWLHRFARPLGPPYPVRWEDRIHNYLIGFAELGLDTAPVKEHFTELLGKKEAETIFRAIAAQAL